MISCARKALAQTTAPVTGNGDCRRIKKGDQTRSPFFILNHLSQHISVYAKRQNELLNEYSSQIHFCEDSVLSIGGGGSHLGSDASDGSPNRCASKKQAVVPACMNALSSYVRHFQTPQAIKRVR